jgi:transcriptional regulator with XRE-family HTH domain
MKARAAHIGQRVKAARRRSGLTQLELARVVGYGAPNVISKLEAGRMPSVEAAVLLDRIARATDSDLMTLLYGEPPTVQQILEEVRHIRRLLAERQGS